MFTLKYRCRDNRKWVKRSTYVWQLRGGAWGALRRAHVHRREAVGRADDVRRLLEAPRVEAPAREHGVRARVRLHLSCGEFQVLTDFALLIKKTNVLTDYFTR